MPIPAENDHVGTATLLHELGNLMLPLLGHGSLALASMPLGHPAQHSVLQMLTSAERAVALVRQVMTFGCLQPAFSDDVDVAAVVCDCAQLLRGALPKTAELVVSVAADLPRLQGDANQLHQVLLNLGLNAMQALAGAGGTVAFAADVVVLPQPLAAVDTMLPPGNYVRLSVHDDGCGIDAAAVAQLFRKASGNRRDRSGCGIGLAITRDIITAHRGGIIVDSEPGAGTCVQVHLPVPATVARV